MAPIRRYLRITKYSVLEVRIYLDQPSLAQTWLLNPRFDILPRIMRAVRPLVLPKLREENERTSKGKAGAKGKKAKGVKDVVHDDDFEVSIFLTDVPTRHSLLTKQKDFKNPRSAKRDNSGKLTEWVNAGTTDQPIDVEDGDEDSVVIREESDEDDALRFDGVEKANGTEKRRGKRQRQDSNDGLFVEDELEVSEDDGFQSKRQRTDDVNVEAEQDDKKKLGMVMTYDGFSIYGRVLCLVVKRKGPRSKPATNNVEGGRQMLENWVSTQAAQEQTLFDDD